MNKDDETSSNSLNPSQDAGLEQDQLNDESPVFRMKNSCNSEGNDINEDQDKIKASYEELP